MNAYLQKQKQSTIDRIIRQDKIIFDTIVRLGGNIHMRVMELRRHIEEPIQENHIKQSLKRLCDAGLIELIGERYDSRGHGYRVTNPNNNRTTKRPESTQT